MKHFVPMLLTIFALLTDPRGMTIYVVKSQVVAVLPPVNGECARDTHAKVYTATIAVCVAEDVDDVARKVNEP